MPRIRVFSATENPLTDRSTRFVSKSTAHRLVNWQRHAWRSPRAIQALPESERTHAVFSYIPEDLPASELPGLRFVLPKRNIDAQGGEL